MEPIVIETALARGVVYRHGAHVTEYRPVGAAPVLFLSAASRFEAGKAIRGGAPICFPWFGGKADDPDAPAHGPARITEWSLIDADDDAATLGVTIAPFDVRFGVVFGQALEMTLAVTNTGGETQTFEEALHSYLHVGDVRQVHITGLERVGYDSKVAGASRPATGEPIRFTGETDRVYIHTDDTCVLHDPVLGRRIIVEKQNSLSTIVWNPWINKSKRMGDFGDDEWPGMCCIETANVAGDAVALEPGATHEMRAVIRVEGI